LLVVKTPLKKLGFVKKEPVVEGAPSGRGFAIGQKRRYNGLVKGKREFTSVSLTRNFSSDIPSSE
jgi:hypothetical protein